VAALAAIPRERFLPPGPWIVQSEQGSPRPTADADVAHVYHNYSVAIDPARQLFNGAPAFVCGLMEALALREGARVLHVGAGLGYYSAMLAHVVGPSGDVLAVEVDHALAQAAADALAGMHWVTVAAGDAGDIVSDGFDAIFVSTGVTHPPAAWLDALADGGRLLLPLTATIPAMGPIGKGVVLLITRRSAGVFDARVMTFIAIYSAIGVRDDALNEQLGKAMMRTPFPRLRGLRRDAHEPSAACWLHGDDFCLELAGGR
jgi:protein-L-isoaspartate(D-aspartate) O-methyltransferase